MQPVGSAKAMLIALEKKGFRAKIVPAACLLDLEREIADLHQKNLLDKDLYSAYLDRFEFKSPHNTFNARSVIIATALQPRVRVTFNRQGRTLPCIIPPTYDCSSDDKIAEFLEDFLKPGGYHLEKRRLPHKILAARSGLARYGTNNITYVPELGSFHRLVAFITDLPGGEDTWGEQQPLEECRNCDACLKACPTGAISPDRFLLHGERCLTFHNEHPGEFASWLDPSWHHCLVGCMICQMVCPVNKDFRKSVVEGPVFSEQETAAIIDGKSLNQIPPEAVRKLGALDMIEYHKVLGRNLSALLEKHNGR